MAFAAKSAASLWASLPTRLQQSSVLLKFQKHHKYQETSRDSHISLTIKSRDKSFFGDCKASQSSSQWLRFTLCLFFGIISSTESCLTLSLWSSLSAENNSGSGEFRLICSGTKFLRFLDSLATNPVHIQTFFCSKNIF